MEFTGPEDQVVEFYLELGTSYLEFPTPHTSISLINDVCIYTYISLINNFCHKIASDYYRYNEIYVWDHDFVELFLIITIYFDDYFSLIIELHHGCLLQAAVV